jgi:dihydrofolate synthase/folylpolyglutamate synthase
MSDKSLAQWLSYQEQVNIRSIELGLDRVRAVWQRMGAARPAPLVITVGGTNGKGSSVALLEAMLRAAGLRVGCYTSPHLLRYNERVRIEGVDADDAALIGAFERIEAARRPGQADEIKLTYFEFGTLTALDLFAGAVVDVAVLEVGLGGRLDAVNIIDADAVLITTVDLDHTEWLGPDRDRIGVEKAGIARAGRPAIVGELNPPQGLLDALAAIGAQRIAAGVRTRFGRGHLDETLAQLVEARRRDLVEHLLPAFLPLLDHRLADAGNGAGRRDRLAFELGK